MSGCPKTNCKHSLTDLFLQLSGNGSASGGGGCGCGSGGSGSGNRRGVGRLLCVLLHHSIFFMHASVCPSSAHVQASLSICVYTQTLMGVCVCVTLIRNATQA